MGPNITCRALVLKTADPAQTMYIGNLNKQIWALTDMAQMGLHEVDSNYNQNVFFKIECPSKSVRNLKCFLCTTKPQPISKLSFRPQPKSKLCFRPLSKSPALVHTTKIMTMCIEEN